MTDFNSKLKLIGGFFTTPAFDDNQFSAADYEKAYNLYHLSKALGLIEWNLTDVALATHLKSFNLREHYADYNYLRDHLKAHDMTLIVYNRVRRYHTPSSRMYFYAWGLLSFNKPNGTIVRGLPSLIESKPGFFNVQNWYSNYATDFEQT